jgi:hypothetical protein
VLSVVEGLARNTTTHWPRSRFRVVDFSAGGAIEHYNARNTEQSTFAAIGFCIFTTKER